jgi:hypothetical protein
MKVTDPTPYLNAIDRDRLMEMLGQKSKDGSGNGPTYVEPSSRRETTADQVADKISMTADSTSMEPSKSESTSRGTKHGKIQVLGDFIDTDAVRISPSI